jgi:apolipoprotein N-acyltransferase
MQPAYVPPVRLLHYRFKFPGALLFVSGAVLCYLNMVRGFRFEWLTCPVFAVCSSFAKTKFFTLTRSNLTNEIAVILVLAGLFLMVFSQEKNETEKTMSLRFVSMLYAFFIQLVYYVFCTIFFYGISYVVMLCLGMVTLFIFYLVIFRVLLAVRR